MIYYLLLPILLLLLVIIQSTILDIFALRWIGLEISLIVVIYAGFRLDAVRGGLLSLLLGFFLDCLTSAIFGLYTFLYTAVFYFSMIVAGKVYAEKPVFIASFTGLCTLLEGLAIVLLYRFFFAADIFYAIPKIFIPQAVVLGLLSPLFFRFFQRFEVFLHARDTRPARQVRARSVQE
jgi:rod shape-determining protein MreD